MNPLLLTDAYKVNHQRMYPEGMSLLYSNFTPRKSRIKGIDHVVFFGLQHFILTYLIKLFNREFFHTSSMNEDSYTSRINLILSKYQRHINVDTKHIAALYDLGYLPIEIKAVEEGTLVPIGVPCFTIKNTHPDFAWLTNYLETLISTMMWQPITSATIAYEYKKLLNKYALETTGSTEGVQWQAHDFSMRGMSSIESGIISGMAHLTSFTGTDVIPAIYQLEESYDATGLIGASVPATEHSVMCMGTKESEIETFQRLLDLYPTGILSVVSDTWDLWKVCTEYVSALKEQILARDGKLVIRPDSGDPVDIICGTQRHNLNYSIIPEDVNNLQLYFRKHKFSLQDFFYRGKMYTIDTIGGSDGFYYTKEVDPNPIKGVIELLWDVFGGTINEKGYKVLDTHIGAIYGDSITSERAKEICERLKAKGFASTNIVFGVGSYTYQYNTRDTFGFAMKATYGEITSNKIVDRDPMTDYPVYDKVVECREIFKDPITDDGTKRSAKGLLRVTENLKLVDQQTWDGEATGLLTTVFKNGELVRKTTLEEIRSKLNG